VTAQRDRPRLVLQGRVLTPGRELAPASLLVDDGRVAWVRPGLRHEPGTMLLTEPGDTVVPGFIDLQVNGFGGRDAQEGADAIGHISLQVPEYGVTGFLPTMISRPLDEACEFGHAAAGVVGTGARVLGAHIEGPFLNPRYRGAHEERWLLEPTPERVERLLVAAPRMVTLAPELPGGLEAVRRLRHAGVLVSAGHTGASYEQGQAAILAGVRFGTHLFNTMTSLHHRKPGIAGALLSDRRVVIGLVADGVHVHPAVLELVARARGSAGVALTTDQTAAAGMPPGQYWLGGREVITDGRTVRRVDGTIAGSAATMDQLVRMLAPLAGLRRAVAMATTTPARALGLRGLGRIAEGLPADLAVLDRDLQVRCTLVGGRLVYAREEGAGAVAASPGFSG
jgi:N-acetylglucosamine-6-phosphate deacetylase